MRECNCQSSMWLTLIWSCRSAEAFVYSSTGCCRPPPPLVRFYFQFFCSGDFKELKFIFHQSLNKMLITENVSNVSPVFVGETVENQCYVTVATLILVQRRKNWAEAKSNYASEGNALKVRFGNGKSARMRFLAIMLLRPGSCLIFVESAPVSPDTFSCYARGGKFGLFTVV